MTKYYGGFWLRLCALSIDVGVLFIMSGLINIAMGLNFYTNADSPKVLYAGLFSMAASMLYYSIIQGMFYGTPGKRAMGLKLVDAATLEQVNIGQAVGRYLMQFVSAVCLGAGYINIGINDKKQGWHDKVAGTLVVKASLIPKLREEEGILPKKSLHQAPLKKAA